MKLFRSFLVCLFVACTLISRVISDDIGDGKSSNVPAASKGKPDVQKRAPKIRFDKTEHDFGAVKEGEDVSAIFKLVNDGAGPLKIRDVKASCSCTATFLSGKVVAPGTTTDLKVTFHSKGYRGKVIKKMFVTSNDPHKPISQLVVKALVKTKAFVLPQEMFFGEVHVNREASREVILRDEGEGSLRISKVESSSPYVLASFMPDAGSYGETLKVKVTLKPGAPLGKLEEKIRIYTNNRDLGTAEVPINAIIVGDISVFPEKLFFGFLAKGKTVRRRLVVTNTGDKPIKILKVTSERESLSTQMKSVEPGRRFEITVSLTPKASDKRILTRLNIYTDSPLQEVIPVEVYGLVRD